MSLSFLARIADTGLGESKRSSVYLASRLKISKSLCSPFCRGSRRYSARKMLYCVTCDRMSKVMMISSISGGRPRLRVACSKLSHL